MKKYKNESTDHEETIIDNEYLDLNLIEEDYNLNPKIFLFITEYMSLSLKEKISKYVDNKNIRSIINPITSDTLIHYLCMNDDNYPLIKLINPDLSEKEQKNNSGQTLLHVAVQNKSYKIIEYLLKNGSNINSKDKKCNTPLHIAVSLSDYNSIQILLKYNPIISILNYNNETPLDIAKKLKNKKIIDIFNSVYYEEDYLQMEKSKNNITFNEYIKNDIYKRIKSKEKLNKSVLNNISFNNCSLDTKNETDNQSVKIYKKKIITNHLKEKGGIQSKSKIKTHKTINLNARMINKSFSKNKSYNFLKRLSPTLRSKYIYRKTSPKSINKYTLIEFDDESEVYEYTQNNTRYFSPKASSKMEGIPNNNFKSETIHNIVDDKKKITSNNYSPILINGAENPNNKIKEIRKTVVHKSPFSFYGKKLKKEDSCKQKLFEFLKEIGMKNYFNILVSEGFDDIDLILKQMNEGFPLLEETLKEAGIILAGDRAKILIRLQEVSNGFNFDFPFEEVYFKNNGSILKWLQKEGLSSYNNKFLEAGYQSLELLLIQMASKFKINENILNDIFIFNDLDKKQILNSLKLNSEKYVKELYKKGTIQRTYSKMVNNNSQSICIII